MRWMRMAGGAAAIAAAMLLTSDVLAGKPGGGGATPAGTIYFRDQASGQAPGPTYVLGAMDGTGANRGTLMRTHQDVRASRRLHGGRRWLLTREFVASEPGFQGGARRDVFAVREDGALHVRLTGQATIEYWNAEWAPDEDASGATVSVLGRQWTGLTASDTVVAGTVGLYTAHLTFDGDGNVVGLDADPDFLVSLGTRVVGGHELPDVQAYSWSPDSTRLVADDGLREQIRVVDVTSGNVLLLGAGAGPDWSPDGSKIAYSRLVPASRKGSKETVALETVRPDGTGVATLLSVNHWVPGWEQWLSGPRWSPDGAYVAYTFTKDSNYVYRVAPDGGGNTNLTPDATTGGPGYGFVLVDWR